MASNFIYSTRDHKFILKEWLDIGKILNFPVYRDFYDPGDVDVLLDQALKVAREVIAPTNDDGENIGVKLTGGHVTVPPSLHKAHKFMQENGWGISDPEEEGHMPIVLRAACSEYFGAANPSFTPYTGLAAGAARLIASFGRPEDMELFLPRMYSGDWGGTMCLTEPGAGSDVGASVTKAYPTADPCIYRIKGTKSFITGGDHDINENIIHLLLARIEGAAPDTRGLSLFIVPKLWVDENGNMTGPNDVTTVAVEHKMGLKGSATCMLSFGDEGSCRGILLGRPPDEKGVAEGIAQMFQLMNSARHGTGHSALYVATVAYNNAVQYAKERVQGRPLSNPRGPAVPIIQHEDVRRMLLHQKATLEAMRALVFKNWYYIDVVQNSDDEQERETASRNIQVLNPLAKAYCSDMAWQLIADAIQVYGGYGFSEEYPVARQARDCKIYSIWEGTNYIQSMDLVGRKWRMENGKLFRGWLAELGGFIEGNQGATGLEREFTLLKTAFDSYQEIYATIGKYFLGQLRLVPVYSTRVLHCTAVLYCGAMMAEQAMVALGKISQLGEGHADYPFYAGKIQSARYYVRNVVPVVNNLAEIIKDADSSVLDIPEEAF
ncbi:MAG TPA: acyl-CoA dehydrogenase [Spirochaetia bacterium]|nr:acyl-CoA dehydrogenase [Spirochaetia bacterium]